ncbi:hypothetical protein PI124_g9899 [Phytophthora idaei]|nr:hypothetical protein PI125_g12317 [Phytophthora idaei]KAG3159970.1 hypothetical protein PI126_g7110 [Phytophthora idaei]KAG3245368.1 hypothetical protein PI124_g9899 [Phytophthora idaei]
MVPFLVFSSTNSVIVSISTLYHRTCSFGNRPLPPAKHIIPSLLIRLFALMEKPSTVALPVARLAVARRTLATPAQDTKHAFSAVIVKSLSVRLLHGTERFLATIVPHGKGLIHAKYRSR